MKLTLTPSSKMILKIDDLSPPMMLALQGTNNPDNLSVSISSKAAKGLQISRILKKSASLLKFFLIIF